MKIVHIFRDIHQKGGVPYEVRSLINSEINCGHELTIIASKKKYNDNVSVNTKAKIYLLGGNIFAKVSAVKRILIEVKPDYIHFYSGWLPFNYLCWIIVKIKKIPYLISLHGILTPAIINKRFGGKPNIPGFKTLKIIYGSLIDRRIIENSIAVHCLSKYEVDICTEKFKNKKTILAPNGIDSKMFNDNSRINKKVFKFNRYLFLGRLDVYQKGLDLLLSAIRILNYSEKYEELSVDLVGVSVRNSKDVLNKYITKFELANVRLKEPVTSADLPELFSNYDYLILPSRFEGLARVVREALQNDLPVIASRESNFGDWVESCKTGFCIENLTANGIAETIKRSINIDIKTYEQIKSNTKLWVNNFTWDKVSNIINHEMEKLLNAKLHN